jgi:type III secretion protein J
MLPTIGRRFLLKLFLLLFIPLAIAGCKVDLNTNLTETEANAILAILLENGIKASKTIEKGVVTVHIDEKDMLQAISLLKQSGYPKQQRESLGSVFEKTSIMSSPFEERVRFIYALSQELSQTLGEIDGVLTARVHIVLPKEQELGGNLVPSSAAVFIKHRPDVDLDFYSPQIKRLVSNAVEGVNYDKVSIVLVQAQNLVTAAAPSPDNTVDTFVGLKIFSDEEGTFNIVTYTVTGIFLVLFLVNVVIALAYFRSRRKTRGGGAAKEFEPA